MPHPLAHLEHADRVLFRGELLAWHSVPHSTRSRSSTSNTSRLSPGLMSLVSLSTTPHSSPVRSEEHTSELQSLMRISYAVFCLKKKKNQRKNKYSITITERI